MGIGIPAETEVELNSAAAIVRFVRTQAGIEQSQLAALVGTTRQIISNYEVGRNEPGANKLLHIIEACGFQFTIESIEVDPDGTDETSEANQSDGETC